MGMCFRWVMSHDEASPEVSYIGSSEVCERLKIDRGTLTRWIQLGKITPAGKLPGSNGAYLWDPEYIDRLAAARRAEQWRQLPAYTDPADPRAPGHKNAS